MEKREGIAKINKELKIIINEASFISMKCRNKVLKMFADTFGCNLDISNYQNVDLSVSDDLKIIYRDDKYSISDDIKNYKDFVSKYRDFRKQANGLIAKKDVNFEALKNRNNILNLIIVMALIIFVITVIYFCTIAFFRGDYYNLLWFLVFIVPAFVPSLKESLSNRLIQAKNYIKSLFKK